MKSDERGSNENPVAHGGRSAPGGSACWLDDIEAVSFDLDDTFWDCAPAIRQAELASYQWLMRHTPRITSRLSETALASKRAQLYAARPELAGDVSAMRKASFEALFSEFGYAAELADEAFAEFYHHRSRVNLYEGVHELLSSLQGRYRIAAITNGNADLELIGIDHYFHTTHHATLAQAAKPAPDMFEACLQNLELPAQRLLHVGDSVETDVGGAHGAGAHACWYNPAGLAWTATRQPPRLSVGSLAELGEYLVY